jgi:hypothetical protein
VSFSVASRYRLSDRVVRGATFVLLLLCPLWAAMEATWPLLVGTCFVAGAGVVLLWHRDALSMTTVLGGGVVLRLAFLPLLPGLTDDAFRYLWDGVLHWDGVNPYRYVPADPALQRLHDTALFERMNSPDYYSIYPPLSQLVFAAGALWYDVGGAGWLPAYYALKALLLGAELAGLGLLARMGEARTVLLYAWNPLVLLETAGQGHTEALVVPLLMLAVWAVRERRGGLASVAVAAAGAVKLYPLLLGPLLLRRFGWRAVWPGALLGALLGAPYAAAYVLPHVAASVDLFARLFEFNAGPYYLAKHGLWLATGSDWSKTLGPLFRGVFLAGLPVLYVMEARWDWSFRRASLWGVGGLFVLSTTVHPWYLVPVVALAVLGERPNWPWLWLGLCSVGTYLFYVDGPYWAWIGLGWGGAALLAGGQAWRRDYSEECP